VAIAQAKIVAGGFMSLSDWGHDRSRAAEPHGLEALCVQDQSFTLK
jgi:hypothetical protein